MKAEGIRPDGRQRDTFEHLKVKQMWGANVSVCVCVRELAGRRRSGGDGGATGTWLTPRHACEAAVLLMVERGGCQQRAAEDSPSQTIAAKEKGECKRAR